eukprot:gene16360-22560_t
MAFGIYRNSLTGGLANGESSSRSSGRLLSCVRAVSSPSPGQMVEMECSRLGTEGKGVCLLDGLVVLCEKALPGEKLVAEITSAKKGYAEARKRQTLEAHRDYVSPPCEHASACHGCTLQTMEYSAQLREKQNQVEQTLRRVGKLEELDGAMRPIVPCADVYAYRNKTSFTWSSTTWVPPAVDKLEGSGDGDLLQSGHAAGSSEKQYLVVITTTMDARQLLMPLATALQTELGSSLAGVVTKVETEDRGASVRGAGKKAADKKGRVKGGGRGGEGKQASKERDAAAPPQTHLNHVLVGEGHLKESMCGLEFEVSPDSFFQTNTKQAETNTKQAEVLYGLVRDGLDLRSDASDVLLDLYCGTGSIGLSLASRCKQVVGFEFNASAVADAKRNAKINGLGNATFVCANLEKEPLVEFQATVDTGHMPSPTVVVVDPARAGLSKGVVDYLIGCGARRVVYASCNPATQARDLGMLCGQTTSSDPVGAAIFRLESVTPCDMFPHTDHVETVAVLAVAAMTVGGAAAFRLESVTPCDMSPHADHVETVVVLDRL